MSKKILANSFCAFFLLAAVATVAVEARDIEIEPDGWLRDIEIEPDGWLRDIEIEPDGRR